MQIEKEEPRSSSQKIAHSDQALGRGLGGGGGVRPRSADGCAHRARSRRRAFGRPSGRGGRRRWKFLPGRQRAGAGDRSRARRFDRHARDAHECARARRRARIARLSRQNPIGGAGAIDLRILFAPAGAATISAVGASSCSAAARAIPISPRIRRRCCGRPNCRATSWSRRRRSTAFIRPIRGRIRKPTRFDELSHAEAIARDLKIMDTAAFALAREAQVVDNRGGAFGRARHRRRALRAASLDAGDALKGDEPAASAAPRQASAEASAERTGTPCRPHPSTLPS